MRVGDRRTAPAWARADCPAVTWDPFFFAASAGTAANARAAAATTASDIRRIFIPELFLWPQFSPKGDGATGGCWRRFDAPRSPGAINAATHRRVPRTSREVT